MIHHNLKECQIWNNRSDFTPERKSQGWLQVVAWKIERMKFILTDMSHKIIFGNTNFINCINILLCHNFPVDQLWGFCFNFSTVKNKTVVNVLGHKYLITHLWLLWHTLLTNFSGPWYILINCFSEILQTKLVCHISLPFFLLLGINKFHLLST